MNPIRSVGPAALLLLAACGGPALVTDDRPARDPYDGPMTVTMSGDEAAPVAQRAGAAALALECEHDPLSGGGGSYDDGLASTQESPEKALDNAFSESGFAATLPASGYRVERRTDDRVLFSYDVRGRTKIAFIVHSGVADLGGDTGWGVESWAQCDPSELPSRATDDLDIGVWEDAAGRRVPTSTIESFDGAEHCDWQDVTFIRLGPDRTDPEFVRDPALKLTDSLTGTFDPAGELPPTADDTGLHRAGRELWLAPDRDRAYLVSIDDRDDVEVWPSSTDRIGCA